MAATLADVMFPFFGDSVIVCIPGESILAQPMRYQEYADVVPCWSTRAKR